MLSGGLGGRLADRFGLRDGTARTGIGKLFEGLQALPKKLREKYRELWASLLGAPRLQAEKQGPSSSAAAKGNLRWKEWAHMYGISCEPGREEELLLAVQTYFALVVKLFIRLLWEGNRGRRQTPIPKRKEWAAFEAGQTHLGRLLGLDHQTPFGWYIQTPSRWQRAFREDIWTPLHTVGERILEEWISGWVEQSCRIEPQRQPWKGHAAPRGKRIEGAEGMGGSESADWPDGLFRDHWKHLYESLLPRSVRHAWGEYATPDNLARYLLGLAGYEGTESGRLVDPACGSGTFLMAALARAFRANCCQVEERSAACQPIPPAWGFPGRAKCDQQATGDFLQRLGERIAGWDRSPLAVLAARANWLLALRPWIDPDQEICVPIDVRDAILPDSSDQEVPDRHELFDVVVGNPPWIVWDHLGPDYREATRPLWQQYGLFSLSAKEGRHGGAKKDLAALMTYVAADRYLKPGGRLALLLPNSLLQTQGAGDGFRRFCLPGPMPLEVLRVEDFSHLRLFGATSQRTLALVLRKGRPTVYPVPYVRWRTPPWWADGPASPEGTSPTPDSRPQGANRGETFWAEPREPDRPSSPWFVRPAHTAVSWRRWLGPSDYQAYLGANTGGANDVFWFDLGEDHQDAETQRVRVRNRASAGRHSAPPVETFLEPDFLFPLLRWRDVQRWKATPSCWILLVQDVHRRCGIDPEWLQMHCPATWKYLQAWETRLRRRAAYQRYQAHAPFYSLYNVGPYTLSPFKVVWRRMDRQIRAAVVEPIQHPRLGIRPIVPQETCSFIPTESVEEAYYLAAVLNSPLVDMLVQAAGQRGNKGFGSPGLLRWIRIPRFEPTHPRHKELAHLGRSAHEAVEQSQAMASLEARMEGLVSAIWADSERPREGRQAGSRRPVRPSRGRSPV